MPKTNRQKKNEGIEDVKELHPQEKQITSMQDIMNDISGGSQIISSNKPSMNGRVPECLIIDCKETKANNFYMSFNPIHAKSGVYPVCKKCMVKIYDAFYGRWKNPTVALFYTCQKFDIGLIETIIDSAINSKMHPFATYMGQYNSKIKKNSWPTSFTFTKEALLERDEVRRDEEDMRKKYDFETMDWDEEDRRNKEDVLRIYGYDVFEGYDTNDKKKMYSVLIDYLDEATIADNFKKSAVVQIVKNVQHIERTNSQMIHLDIVKNAKEFGDLTKAKNSLMKSNLDIAKDNGISLNHSSNKSKGAGTLSGILKDLQEKGIVESDVNLFDIETLGGIKKVADVSNRSILDQIMLDENSYTEMIKEQKDLIDKYRTEAEKLKEENRLLKIKKLDKNS
jgi:hypothetical protein